jgi:hypothetical protein
MAQGTRSGPEIQAALRDFVARWAGYGGTETAEAHTFLDELFACYGTDRKAGGAVFEHFAESAGFMDLHWPGVCVVEMKRPSRTATLSKSRDQMFNYWKASSNAAEGRRSARYVVLCSFHRFEVWEPAKHLDVPQTTFNLADLPERYEVLQFLSSPAEEPDFSEHHKVLTERAANSMAALYESLAHRAAAPTDELQRFVMQTVWTLFAEDLGMLEGHPLRRFIARLQADPSRISAAELGLLFYVLGQEGDHNRVGLLAGTRYVNGELFSRPAVLSLRAGELDMLADAATHEWRQVNPTIFGSLLEGVLGPERRSELGAHYTHEADILKIVIPTIVRPWRERIAATETPGQAHALLDELCRFRVLDPACGCGNFLYVAYRELRGLENQLKDRIRTLASSSGQPAPPGPWPYYPLTNLYGFDTENVAVLISRVTLWMGHRQMIERHGEAENQLPLVDLEGIRRADALREPWPEVDCIVGNPPFLGSQHLRGHFGDDYVTWLEDAFEVGVKDYCVYWFRLAQQHLRPGQRAGLVGTNSVSQNRARSASLAYITGNVGVITDAVSSQKWPGESKVHVSLVNWVKDPGSPPDAFTLDGAPVSGVDAALHDAAAGEWQPAKLPANAGRCFQGPIPVGDGFIIPEAEARKLLAREEVNYADIVRPYLTGDDIAEAIDQGPRRWVIDFGEMPLERAQRYRAALTIVRARVKPKRDENHRKARRERWWQFGEKAVGMRQAIGGRPRWIASTAFGKRFLLSWQQPWTCPSGKIYVFAFDDDYSMGVLQSRAHVAWAWERGGTLKADLSYTPTTVFQTFPWPNPTETQRERVAEASRLLLDRRATICKDQQIGLTELYNATDEGAYTDLAKLHRQLDEAAAACYSWPTSTAQHDAELVPRLRSLNQEIAEAGARPSCSRGLRSDETHERGRLSSHTACARRDLLATRAPARTARNVLAAVPYPTSSFRAITIRWIWLVPS